jgi:hypothetical protein
MAKKPAARKPAPKTTKTTSRAKPRHKENPIEHLEQVIESRFLEGAEMATETTSAETNAVLAALAAIEGPPDTGQPPKARTASSKRKTPAGRARKR